MYVCMYVCMCMCVYIYKETYIYIYIDVWAADTLKPDAIEMPSSVQGLGR